MIIHLDLGTFFCSCERINNLSAVGKIVLDGRGDPFIFNPKLCSNVQLLSLNSCAFFDSLFYARIDSGSYFRGKIRENKLLPAMEQALLQQR